MPENTTDPSVEARAERLTDVVLVWGTPSDIEMNSDGGGDYASTFRLTPSGAAKIAKALGATKFRDAEFCGHTYPERGDAVHVAGEPVDMICLASPIGWDERGEWQAAQHPASASAQQVARNIINQIGDLYSERIPSPDWVKVRQETNDALDAFVLKLVRQAAQQSETRIPARQLRECTICGEQVTMSNATEEWERRHEHHNASGHIATRTQPETRVTDALARAKAALPELDSVIRSDVVSWGVDEYHAALTEAAESLAALVAALEGGQTDD